MLPRWLVMAGMHGSNPTAAPYRFRILANGVETHRAETVASNDPEELWHEAAMSACDMIRNMYGRIEPGLDWRFEVTDGTGKVISLFSFKAEMPA
ncbi:hypothetical protein [Bradyrhizobium sp. LTSP885]|uniref:DUF6894 family protein n=1 Tax=Bradyrhizobium sp. LTSP885 TaxID=1619232 RepID=UPI000A9D1AF0|nr:hypothetical protein [Bradyrhizobium sp. LTSP885]